MNWAIWTIGTLVAIVLLAIFAVVAAFWLDGDPKKRAGGSSVECWRVHRWGPNDCEYVRNDYKQLKRKAYVVIPGILAKNTQVEPLMTTLEDYEVFALVYAGLRYDRELLSTEAAELVSRFLDEYDEVVINGLSHGGMSVCYVAEKLGHRASEVTQVILHDPPTGQKTIIPLNGLPRWVGGFLQFTPGDQVNSVLGWVLKLMLQLPNPKNIILPSEENQVPLLGEVVTLPTYVDWVKRSAANDLAGHKFSMWYTELGDMIRAGKQGLPLEALLAVKKIDVIYYADKNGTVVQPQAAVFYEQQLPHAVFWKISGTHCGFRENYDDNVSTLQSALEPR